MTSIIALILMAEGLVVVRCPISEQFQYLMMSLLKDDDWRVFTEMMYDMIDTLANIPKEVVAKMNAHKVQFQKEDNSEVIAMNFTLQTKSYRQSETQQSLKMLDRGSETNRSCSDDDKHAFCRNNLRDTLELNRCHLVGHIPRYSPNIVQVKCVAPTNRVAVVITMSTTSIKNYLTIVTSISAPKECWLLAYVICSHVCGN